MLIRLVCVLCIFAQLCACTTLRPVDAGALDSIGAGDKVRIVKHDGTEHAFTVERSDGSMICGGECVRTSEIATVERREFDGWKTTGLVAMLLYLGLAAAAASAGPGMAFMTGPVMP